MNKIISDRVIKNFDNAAETYDKAASVQTRVIDDFISFFPPGEFFRRNSVLELGAGTGLLTSRILPFSPSFYLASDISTALLRINEKKHGAYNQFSTKIADMNTADFRRNFDFVISSSTFQWALDYENLFRNIRRHIVKGGELIFSIFTTGTLREIKEACLVSDIPFPGQNLSSKEELSRILSISGLEVLHSETKSYTDSYSTVREMLASLKKTGTFAAGSKVLSIGEIKKMLSSLEKQFEEKNSASLSYESVFFRCRKT